MSDERLLAFVRSMADAVRSGLPAAQTLRRLAKDHGRRLTAAADAVDRGESMYAALDAQKILPAILIAVIRAGEESGKIDVFLDRFAASLDSELEFRRRLGRVLAYPAFAAALAAALFLAFATKAAPLLLQPLIDAGATVPPEAFKIVRVGTFVSKWWPWLLGGAAAAYVLLRLLADSAPARMAWALAGHCIPGARFASEHGRWERFESALELLLAAGLRPRQIMEIMQENFRHDLVTKRRLSRGARMLTEGRSFFESLGPCLPSDDRAQFETAEKAGRLDETLKKLAAGHRERQLHRLKLAATGVQLGALVCLAPVVLALVVSIAATGMASLGPAQEAISAVDRISAMPRPLSAPRPAALRSDAGFNERQAGKVVAFMEEHQPAGSKPFQPPKLKSRRSIKGLEPTSVQPSSLQNY